MPKDNNEENVSELKLENQRLKTELYNIYSSNTWKVVHGLAVSKLGKMVIPKKRIKVWKPIIMGNIKYYGACANWMKILKKTSNGCCSMLIQIAKK